MNTTFITGGQGVIKNMSDLIKKEDAIAYIDRVTNSGLGKTKSLDYIHKYISALPSAEPQGELVSKDDVLKVISNRICDNKWVCEYRINSLPSAEAEWIPCSERMPSELEAVNVTWVNHNPPVYYQYTKDVPNADTAVYYRGAWYWWDATVIDLLGEYGGAYIHGIEPIDKDIEVIAWQPLPTPYKGE